MPEPIHNVRLMALSTIWHLQRPAAAGSVHGTPGATHPTRTAAAEAERGAF